MIIARKIMALRAKAGMSQNQLAKYLKLNKSTVSLWERGMRFPTFRHCLALMMLLYRTTGEEVSYVYYKRGEPGNEA